MYRMPRTGLGRSLHFNHMGYGPFKVDDLCATCVLRGSYPCWVRDPGVVLSEKKERID